MVLLVQQCMEWGGLLPFVSAPVQSGGEYSFEALQGSGAKYFTCDSMKVHTYICVPTWYSCACKGSQEQAVEVRRSHIGHYK